MINTKADSNKLSVESVSNIEAGNSIIHINNNDLNNNNESTTNNNKVTFVVPMNNDNTLSSAYYP
jgi:hypothetical protein